MMDSGESTNDIEGNYADYFSIFSVSLYRYVYVGNMKYKKIQKSSLLGFCIWLLNSNFTEQNFCAYTV
jgi:hypothetical protein